MATSAPPSLELLNLISAKFFSKRVFPIKVPSPNPYFEIWAGLVVLIYGSPSLSFSIKSLGNPGPSSLIITSVSFLLLFKIISIFLLLYLLALPIKFLRP